MFQELKQEKKGDENLIKIIKFLEQNIEFETKLLDRLRLKHGTLSYKYRRKKIQIENLKAQLKNSVHSLAS